MADVGYIHASYADQLERVAVAVYADDPEPLVALSFDTDELTRRGIGVRDEAGDPAEPNELYPHIYGAVPVAAVTAALPARISTEEMPRRLVVDAR